MPDRDAGVRDRPEGRPRAGAVMLARALRARSPGASASERRRCPPRSGRRGPSSPPPSWSGGARGAPPGSSAQVALEASSRCAAPGPHAPPPRGHPPCPGWSAADPPGCHRARRLTVGPARASPLTFLPGTRGRSGAAQGRSVPSGRMTHVKRTRTVLGLTVAAAMLSLTACGGDDGPAARPADSTSQGAVRAGRRTSRPRRPTSRASPTSWPRSTARR